MRDAIIRLWKDDGGAVAPTVALSLIGLIAASGLAFDYAHMASLDTELQQAADQAALAAATQLDGGSDAQTRAAAAANDLIRNVSLMADAAGGPSGDAQRVQVTLAFYKSYDEDADTFGAVAASGAGADSKVVRVTVVARKAVFAFTPILGALNSGNLSAEAVASLSAAVCKAPPLMICVPGTGFPTASDIGKGILLEPGGGGAWAPGNYGYLDFGNGASGVKINLGKNNDAASCFDADNGIPTEPGNQASVTKFLNTRFDLYEPSVTACDSSTGDYCPAQNTRKDMTRTEEFKVDGDAGVTPANPGCGAAGVKVTADFAYDSAETNFSRDSNQASCTTNDNSCPKFGNGTWDRANYAAIHGMTSAQLASAVGKDVNSLRRWDVYLWEIANSATRMTPRLVSSAVDFKEQGKSGKGTYTFTNKCSYPTPKNGTAVASGANQKDRRLLTVALVDCTGQTGKFDAKVLRYADMFLTQPSLDRGASTGKDQIYVELIRVAQKANGESAFQYYLRQKPRLLR